MIGWISGIVVQARTKFRESVLYFCEFLGHKKNHQRSIAAPAFSWLATTENLAKCFCFHMECILYSDPQKCQKNSKRKTTFDRISQYFISWYSTLLDEETWERFEVHLQKSREVLGGSYINLCKGFSAHTPPRHGLANSKNGQANNIVEIKWAPEEKLIKPFYELT